MNELPHPGSAETGTLLSAPRDRRAFLRDCARYPLLAGLAVVGAALALREGDPDDTAFCLKQRVCRGCGLLDGCSLPQAVETRKRPS